MLQSFLTADRDYNGKVNSEESDKMLETNAKDVRQVSFGFQPLQPEALFLSRKNSRQQGVNWQMQWQITRS